MKRMRKILAVTGLSLALLGGGLFAPATAASSGLNDFSCTPSAAHPRPVVMLHGLGANGTVNWFFHAPQLVAAGYCVFTPTYGTGAFAIGGLQSMRDSAAEVRDYVNRVLERTGAEEVDLVGHSEGTTVSAYFLKFLGGADKVENFVGFGSNFKGTTFFGLTSVLKALMPWLPGVTELVRQQCGACLEYLPPHPFLDDLAAGGFTVPGVRYTSIMSRFDSVVVPYTSGRIDEPGVDNIVLQDQCWFDVSGHLAMAASPNVTTLIKRGLQPENPPAMRCQAAFPAPF